MNELNYASVGASKKLVNNGIVLEAESVWGKLDTGDYGLFYSWQYANDDFIPAPCFTDVWRELPAKIGADHILEIYKEYGFTKAQYWGLDLYGYSKNPTDALIDLLVWLKGEGKNEKIYY